MKKKLVYFLFICLINSIIPYVAYQPCLHGVSFDDLFKDIDWDKVAQDMEKMMQGSGPPDTPQPHQRRKVAKQRGPAASKQKTPRKKPKLVPKKTDHRSLFLDPLATSKDKDQHDVLKLKQKAYRKQMGQFVKSLKAIEMKTDASTRLSPEFKEKFATFKRSIDTILVAKGMIDEHEDIYLPTFFSPSNNKLRNKIYRITTRLEELNKQVSRFSAKYKQDPIQTLMQQAEQPFFSGITSSKKRTNKRRHKKRLGSVKSNDKKKSKKKQQVKKKQEIKLNKRFDMTKKKKQPVKKKQKPTKHLAKNKSKNKKNNKKNNKNNKKKQENKMGGGR